MTVISFQGQFAEAVDERRKTQTIRAGKRKWRVGQTLHLYSGGYRKGEKRRRLGVGENPKVVKVQHIVISSVAVKVDRRNLMDAEIFALARADGFEDETEFYDYFLPPSVEQFEGTIIHWDWS